MKNIAFLSNTAPSLKQHLIANQNGIVLIHLPDCDAKEFCDLTVAKIKDRGPFNTVVIEHATLAKSALEIYKYFDVAFIDDSSISVYSKNPITLNRYNLIDDAKHAGEFNNNGTTLLKALFSFAHNYKIKLSEKTFYFLNSGGTWGSDGFPTSDPDFCLEFYQNNHAIVDKFINDSGLQSGNDWTLGCLDKLNEKDATYADQDITVIVKVQLAAMSALYSPDNYIIDEETPNPEKIHELGFVVTGYEDDDLNDALPKLSYLN